MSLTKQNITCLMLFCAVPPNSSVYDINDPLYVHPSDIPNLNLVPQELRGSENYGVWSKAMKLALKCKSKLGFIDGKCPKPSADSPYLDQWEKCNSFVLSWILKCVSNEIYNGLVYCDMAFDAWNDLYDQFNKVNRARIFSLFKDIYSHVQGANTVTVTTQDLDRCGRNMIHSSTYLIVNVQHQRHSMTTHMNKNSCSFLFSPEISNTHDESLTSTQTGLLNDM